VTRDLAGLKEAVKVSVKKNIRKKIEHLIEILRILIFFNINKVIF